MAVRQRSKALGAVARLEESVMDMTPDETRDFLASKRIMRWDKRKKKYIKVRDVKHSCFCLVTAPSHASGDVCSRAHS